MVILKNLSVWGCGFIWVLILKQIGRETVGVKYVVATFWKFLIHKIEIHLIDFLRVIMLCLQKYNQMYYLNLYRKG